MHSLFNHGSVLLGGVGARVHNGCGGHQDISITCSANAIPKVDVFEVHEVTLVEAAEPLEYLGSHEHCGA